ncbi:unnamed protein product, partial [Musa hybrid cultivar]
PARPTPLSTAAAPAPLHSRLSCTARRREQIGFWSPLVREQIGPVVITLISNFEFWRVGLIGTVCGLSERSDLSVVFFAWSRLCPSEPPLIGEKICTPLVFSVTGLGAGGQDSFLESISNADRSGETVLALYTPGRSSPSSPWRARPGGSITGGSSSEAPTPTSSRSSSKRSWWDQIVEKLFAAVLRL